DDGHIWIFSTSHGRARPSFIHKSAKPYDVSAFERVQATRLKDGKPVPIANFSYMQVWHLPGKGFVAFFTKYSWPAARTLAFMTSPDGESWSEWKRLAAIEKGHYQVSAANKTKVASTFNFHPDPKGLNWRTNLYYIESDDLGKTWRGASGHDLELPLRKEHNGALVADYRKQGLNVYMKDLRFDADGRPVILYITSKGYRAGPQNDPRTWTTARWTGKAWDIRPAFTSDNNYDMGSLMIDGDTWRIVGPTDTGPQPYNPGGEMAMWESRDRGKTWKKVKQLTTDSPRNHTYARLPVNAHRGFISLWADGHGRKPSTSTLYFADSKGTVYVLPRTMEGETARPEVLK
ncbi:MAG: BNR-4 repeat-containing protein, partial [Planctomycetota bacterium]